MNSSTQKTNEALAPKPDTSELLVALRELANLRDDPVAFGRFERDWPRLIRVDDRTGPGWWASIVVATVPAFVPTQFAHMYRRREALRRIWRGDSEMLTMLLLPEIPPEELLPEEREAYIEKTDADGRTIELAKPLPVTFDWQRGQIEYKPQTEFQRALYALFRQARLAKVCANPDCPAKYFIALKTAQQYCSNDCAQVFQREWKRNWWKEKGTKWRRKKSRGKRGKG